MPRAKFLALCALGLWACGPSGASGVDAGPDATETCGGEICVDQLCRYDTCIPDLGNCETHDDCPGDSYCDVNSECIPYGVPSDVINDPECVRAEPLDGVNPVTQCEWTGPSDPGDPTFSSTFIYSAPIVADLNLDNDPNRLQPSIIVTTWEGLNGARIGTLRVFDGRTCTEQLRIGGANEPTTENRPAYGTQWAVGDLDNDVPTGGRPEIIGLHNTGDTNDSVLNLYAFKIDIIGAPTFARMWYGRDCNTGLPIDFATNRANFGPGLWDLDDDGTPEILIDSMVFDADGCLLNQVEDFNYVDHGRINTIADVDLDGQPELVMADRIARWDGINTEWVDEAFFIPDNAQQVGHVAVADVGQYSELPGQPVPNNLPEIIVVSAESAVRDPDSTGTIRVQRLDGTIVWGPTPLHFTSPEIAGGHGGPPTASDFDGDGQVELAAAGNQYYVVYDPDCEAAIPAERPGGACDRALDMQGLPDGLLWAQLSQDRSSSATGSSIFDFDGDAAAEAVYGDECYLRGYAGATGEVVFSIPASNGTGFELPVIADVDGDFASEIVVARTPVSTCPSPDPLFPNSGAFVSSTGFAILRDPFDRWAASRPIWNQHAYSITNVTDDGQIPRASQVAPNWVDPSLNNFRQNNQGELGVLNLADLTAVFTDIADICENQSGPADLSARVCNRGTNPATDGVVVDFNEYDGATGLTTVCSVETTRFLLPGECEDVSCSGVLGGTGDVRVAVDPGGLIADCHPGNNDGAGTLQLCVD